MGGASPSARERRCRGPARRSRRRQPRPCGGQRSAAPSARRRSRRTFHHAIRQSSRVSAIRKGCRCSRLTSAVRLHRRVRACAAGSPDGMSGAKHRIAIPRCRSESRPRQRRQFDPSSPVTAKKQLSWHHLLRKRRQRGRRRQLQLKRNRTVTESDHQVARPKSDYLEKSQKDADLVSLVNCRHRPALTKPSKAVS